ncbi:MAG: hypothetical protein JJT82_09780 [Legionellaceae bacterium]|nr:hypothetical protein [Legionellaceae bacterium]
MTKKSAMPNFKEVMDFAGKFARDLKKSVSEIIDDYQKARELPEEEKSEVVHTPPQKTQAAPTKAAETTPPEMTPPKDVPPVEPKKERKKPE